MRLRSTSPSVIAGLLLLAASVTVVAGCGRRGPPMPVKAETAAPAERRSSADVVEERARLGATRTDRADDDDATDAATSPFPTDTPDQVIQNRRRGSFFLDFLL